MRKNTLLDITYILEMASPDKVYTIPLDGDNDKVGNEYIYIYILKRSYIEYPMVCS